jgi:hypothetical protein
LQIYPPSRVRRRPPADPARGLDRFALVFAIFSAFTFFGTLAMLCAVFTLAALLVRNDLRWGQLAGIAITPPESPLVVVESPLPAPTPTDTATPEPTPTLPESPLETPAILEFPPTIEPPAPVEAFATETPTSIPPPFPPLDASGSEFVAQATNHVGSMLATLNQLSALLSAPQIGDAVWQSQLDSQIATARNVYNALVALQPPAELAPFHSNMVSVSAGCLGGLYTVEEAIRFSNEAAIQAGLEQVNACLPALANINSQLVSGSYGGYAP